MKPTATAPSVLVIFGITGNLSQHMLLPALYHLEAENLLPDQFVIIGIFRREPDVGAILKEAELQILRTRGEADPLVLEKLKNRIHPLKMDSTVESDFQLLRAKLDALDISAKAKLNHLFYLAIPPSIFKKVISNLASVKLNNPESTDRASRILVEKPFGDDLASAEELISYMSTHFEEHQMFRIDHYLAKETAQNILTFRFNNPLIEGIWSRQFIDHIQISAVERIGIHGRAAFYEHMGALRDFVQSHLMQLMALIMMEYPHNLTPAAIHREKLKLLESIEPIAPNHVDDVAVRGQYATYRNEVENPESNVETFAAIKFEVSNSRWGGVPVLLRTGKSLGGSVDKSTEISIVFKDRDRHDTPDNLLTIRIQPNEGISLKLLAKKPGFSAEFQPVEMNFDYNGSFDGHQPDAYQRVLIDAMRGDQSLFATSAEVLASWKILQPILDSWQSSSTSPEIYQAGSWGPSAAATLAKQFGCEWINTK